MTKLVVKGHEITLKVTKTATDRKAVQFANNIVEELRKLGITRDDIEIEINILGSKRVPATLEFWANGYYLRFTYSMAKRFIDNLYIIQELIKLEVAEVLAGKKDLQEFLHQFQADDDEKELKKELKEAKLTLGLEEDETDVDKINKIYKKLARAHHPDLGGNLDEFQKINKAHKLIKKEMGL